MKKLSLDLDALAVESFTIPADADEKGTVHGNQMSLASCGGPVTCGIYCSWTDGVHACRSVCGATCIP